MESFLYFLDIAGTFVFAVSGAMAGVYKRLDVFGIAVLAFVTGTVGGIGRDLLIGAVPPLAIEEMRYLVTTTLAALLVFIGHRFFERMKNPVLLFDAAGLSLFCVAGSLRALDFGISPFMAIMLGMLTGIGGGMVRDVLVNHIPAVLERDMFYATAAFAGAALTVIGTKLSLPALPVWLTAAATCFALRYMALRCGWRLPAPRIDD